ncbi:3'-5' exoribonuclease [Eubacterium oxidoreducens]|uniref:3'-5' exoribonuclease n=2 Tax=Eubacterium oxidoreducens TaxID=1732 RepID=A0A1G6CFP0_EUBOX|nr:3'-5' exoribonuclease [Eubacterium oxidoreducens]
MEMKYIQDLKEGDRISEVYLCKQKRTLVAKNGKNYDSLILQDKTGTMDGKIWDLGSSGIEEFDTLDYVMVMGDVTSFQGALQLNIKRVRKVEEGEYDPAEYLPVSERNIDEMYEELKTYAKSVENPYLHELLSKIFLESKELEKRFKFHSAAKTVHHGYVGGLVEHTLGVTGMCDFMAKTYPILNRDLLITAAMLHDIGKLEELSTFPENDYTDPGQLLGHIVIGTEWIGRYIRSVEGFPVRLGNELKHCIIAHHGELEFGSPKKPALAEAMALNFADNIDAKMETMKELFAANAGAAPGEWLGYNRLLESNVRKTTLD